MDCSLAAAMIAAGLMVSGCASDGMQPHGEPSIQASPERERRDDYGTAGGMPAIVPRMDDRFGHDDRFGYDVPHRDWSKSRRR